MFKLATTSLVLVFALTAGSAFAQSGMTASPMARMSKADMKTMEKCKMMKPDAMMMDMKCKKAMAMAKPMAAPMATPAPMAPAGAMSSAMSGTMKPETPMKK